MVLTALPVPISAAPSALVILPREPSRPSRPASPAAICNAIKASLLAFKERAILAFASMTFKPSRVNFVAIAAKAVATTAVVLAMLEAMR